MSTWATPAAGQAAAPISPAAWAGLQRDVASLVDRYQRQTGAVVGISVRDTAADTAIISTRADESFVPASNLKLLTTAAALAKLGADFQFTTSVYCRGQDVIVVGDFDPTIGDPRLAQHFEKSIYAELDSWAAAVAEHLAGRPAGDVILLTPGYAAGSRPATWPARHNTAEFGAPVSPLNFRDNCIGVSFELSGGEVKPVLSPTSRHIRVVSEVRPGTKHLWRMVTAPDVSAVTLSGTVSTSVSNPYPVAVDSPQMLLGRVLADRLARAGVAVSGAVRVDSDSDSPGDDVVLVAETRTPIAHAVWLADQHSLNMASECLLLRSGDGTWSGSTAAMTDTLVRSFGVNADDVTIQDGSGLSPGNRATPGVMTSVLAAAVKGEGGEMLLNSLPVAGVPGHVPNRLTEPAYRGRVLAKTGYIFGSQCLSGFILDADGLPVLTYSILINRVPDGGGDAAHDLQDDICRELVDALDAGEPD